MADTNSSELLEAMKGHVLEQRWTTPSHLIKTISAMESGNLPSPLHKALLTQRLINANQASELEALGHSQKHYGDFKVLRKLGSGAMGDVYLAQHQSSGTQVALKVINQRYAGDEQFIKRFTRETDTLQKIEHPGVARSLGTGIEGDEHYLALEYVSGPSLADLLEQNGPLPERYVLRLIQAIAEGLDYVYNECQVLHRDLKPENILTVPDPKYPDPKDRNLYVVEDQAKLIDFGLARNFEQDDRLTMTGITMGTPHYMSPEQIRGNQNLDLRSDLYGLAATMFHLLTGKTPYAGHSPGEVMTSHLTEPVPDPHDHVPGITPETRSLVMMSMAKSPDDRYLNYKAFVKACQNYLNRFGDKGSETGIQLLRKPMVVNHKKGKASSDKKASVTTKQVLKKKNSKQAVKANGHASSLPAIIDVEDELPTNDTEQKQQLRPPAEKLISNKNKSKHLKKPRHINPPHNSNKQQPDQSKAISESAIPNKPLGDLKQFTKPVEAQDETPGMGLIPWLILGVALAILAWLVLIS